MPLRKVWPVLDAPTGKRLAPLLGEMVAALERCGELHLDPEVRGEAGGDVGGHPSTAGWRRIVRRCS